VGRCANRGYLGGVSNNFGGVWEETVTYLSPRNRIKAVALLLVIAACGASAAHTLSPLFQTDRSQAESILQNDYQRYNAAWFAGNLPADTVVHYSAPPGRPDAMGLTEVDGDHFVIYVDPKYYHLNQKAAEFTLMHEMCHISQWKYAGEGDDHGPQWTACMTKLADDGALKEIW
jgi:hypothetical protein